MRIKVELTLDTGDVGEEELARQCVSYLVYQLGMADELSALAGVEEVIRDAWSGAEETFGDSGVNDIPKLKSVSASVLEQ